MPLDFNIEDTTFSKQIYDAGTRFACDEFMHAVGYLMGRSGLRLDERRKSIVFGLSPRELSDLIVHLIDGPREAVLDFLENPRESSPRGGRVVRTNQTGTD